MRRGAAWAGAALAVALAAPAFAAGPQSSDAIARGRYIATAGDCAACHTAPGGAPYAGGLAVPTPFGTIVSTNITPDRETGIGAWTNAQFARAVRHGIAPGGRHLYPAMPYPAYTIMTDKDIADLRAYLATIQPVHNKVVANQLPFPFSIRAGMIAWNLLEFSAHPFRPDPAKSAEWNRGAYLVQGLGHCGTCHTAKSMLGGDEGPAFGGAAITGWYAPPLNGDKRAGLGAWSVDDIVAYLGTGWGGGQVAAGPMAEVVQDSTSHMTTADLRAIATYLKDLPAPPAPAPAPLATSTPAMRDGARLYDLSCSACHGAAGKGIAGLFPTLSGSAVVQAHNPAMLLDVVLNGGRGAATGTAPTGPAMPAFGWQLSNQQIAAILTFIRNSWGNAAAEVSPDAVAGARHRSPS